MLQGVGGSGNLAPEFELKVRLADAEGPVQRGSIARQAAMNDAGARATRHVGDTGNSSAVDTVRTAIGEGYNAAATYANRVR